MHILTVQINNQDALKALYILKEKRFIKIIEDSNIHSPVLPGKSLSFKAFKTWIVAAETDTTTSVKIVKQKWENKKRQLAKLTK